MEMQGCEDPASKTFKKLSCSGFRFDIARAGSRGETWTGRTIHAPLNQWLWKEILWPPRRGSRWFLRHDSLDHSALNFDSAAAVVSRLAGWQILQRGHPSVAAV